MIIIIEYPNDHHCYLGQLVNHTDQEGCHCQHHRQVHLIRIGKDDTNHGYLLKGAHSDGRVEEVWEAEEGGGVADGDHQEGGQEGHQGLGKSIFKEDVIIL